MSYTIQEEKSFEQPETAVFAAVQGAVEGLQGKVLKKDDQSKMVEVKFDKKIHGKVLGDRTHFVVQVDANGGSGTRVNVEGYPINAVGQKLMFGARKGVTRTVMNWFWAHVDHRLKQSA